MNRATAMHAHSSPRDDHHARSRLTRAGSVVSRALQHALLGAIAAYRLIVSPVLPSTCRYVPSCSAYARDAVETHGPFRGAWLAVRRLLRCHPWGGCGHDPVPTHQHPGRQTEKGTAADRAITPVDGVGSLS